MHPYFSSCDTVLPPIVRLTFNYSLRLYCNCHGTCNELPKKQSIDTQVTRTARSTTGSIKPRLASELVASRKQPAHEHHKEQVKLRTDALSMHTNAKKISSRSANCRRRTKTTERSTKNEQSAAIKEPYVRHLKNRCRCGVRACYRGTLGLAKFLFIRYSPQDVLDLSPEPEPDLHLSPVNVTRNVAFAKCDFSLSAVPKTDGNHNVITEFGEHRTHTVAHYESDRFEHIGENYESLDNIPVVSTIGDPAEDPELLSAFDHLKIPQCRRKSSSLILPI